MVLANPTLMQFVIYFSSWPIINFVSLPWRLCRWAAIGHHQGNFTLVPCCKTRTHTIASPEHLSLKFALGGAMRLYALSQKNLRVVTTRSSWYGIGHQSSSFLSRAGDSGIKGGHAPVCLL